MPDYLSIARQALDRPKERRQFAAIEEVLKGPAVELWSNSVGGLFIVADEDDVRRFCEPRGEGCTGAELRLVVQIGDPTIVFEIHEWKRTLNGRVRG
jgi:hypothetical protein